MSSISYHTSRYDPDKLAFNIIKTIQNIKGKYGHFSSLLLVIVETEQDLG